MTITNTKPAKQAVPKAPATKEQPISASGEIVVKLAKASTYVHSDGKVFVGTNSYRLPAHQAKDLLSVSLSGVPVFKVDSSDEAVEKAVKSPKDSITSTAVADAEKAEDDSGITITHAEPVKEDDLGANTNDGGTGELDTGTVALVDADGNKVGVQV